MKATKLEYKCKSAEYVDYITTIISEEVKAPLDSIHNASWQKEAKLYVDNICALFANKLGIVCTIRYDNMTIHDNMLIFIIKDSDGNQLFEIIAYKFNDMFVDSIIIKICKQKINLKFISLYQIEDKHSFLIATADDRNSYVKGDK